MLFSVFFFQAEDGIRDLVRSRGLGDVYKRQAVEWFEEAGLLRLSLGDSLRLQVRPSGTEPKVKPVSYTHLTLPTSDLV